MHLSSRTTVVSTRGRNRGRREWTIATPPNKTTCVQRMGGDGAAALLHVGLLNPRRGVEFGLCLKHSSLLGKETVSQGARHALTSARARSSCRAAAACAQGSWHQPRADNELGGWTVKQASALIPLKGSQPSRERRGTGSRGGLDWKTRRSERATPNAKARPRLRSSSSIFVDLRRSSSFVGWTRRRQYLRRPLARSLERNADARECAPRAAAPFFDNERRACRPTNDAIKSLKHQKAIYYCTSLRKQSRG